MRGLVALVVLALVAGPALAAGPGNDTTFVLDESQSFIEMGFYGSPSFTYGSSPLAGSFVLNLSNTECLPADWNVHCEFEGINAASTAPFSFGFGATTMHWLTAGALQLTDFDEYDNDSCELAGGPAISSCTMVTQMYVYGIGYMSALSPPYFTLDEWVPHEAAPGYGLPFAVQVANDNSLGIGGAGAPEVESTIHMRGFYPVQTGVTLDFILHLAGQGACVPEPATLGLVGLAGLALLRRRR